MKVPDLECGKISQTSQRKCSLSSYTLSKLLIPSPPGVIFEPTSHLSRCGGSMGSFQVLWTWLVGREEQRGSTGGQKLLHAASPWGSNPLQVLPSVQQPAGSRTRWGDVERARGVWDGCRGPLWWGTTGWRWCAEIRRVYGM